MKSIGLLCAAFGVCLAFGPAYGSSFLATTDTFGASLANGVESGSDSTSSAFDDKQVVAARDEAASFVASNGVIRAAQLEEAFAWLRSQGLQHSDHGLAEAILARSH